MLVISPEMEAYLKGLESELNRAMAVAQEARTRGIDPRTTVEIPIASDLADRVEALMNIKGVAVRLRELESTMSREEASLHIGDDFVHKRFGETNREEILDHAIRTAMAILTEGVVAAPTEGIAKVSVGKNDDGSEYLKIFYAGPIRSAGGTAQALSVLVGDYVRRALGINRYIPREEEIERYVEEIRQYNSIMSLQYLPTDSEIRMIIKNCPVCIDGEATEQQEVSGHRNLERVETNVVRGGMALVVAEGLALKAPKVQKNVRKMKMDGWDWLEELISGVSKGAKGDDHAGVKPKDKYLRDLIGGRPVFSYPMRKGGFRLRYGRSRNTGFAAGGLNPATMHLLGDFLAVGTQMKVERPGKAAGIVPVDSIQGPTVRLKNGDVLRVDDVKTAKKIQSQVDRILDVGEILISFGEFLENNHPLIPSAYCEEWWRLEGGTTKPATEDEAIALTSQGVPLYPDYTFFWDDIPPQQVTTLSDFVREKGKIAEGYLALPNDPSAKGILEELLVPHTVREGEIRVAPYRVLIACLGLDENLKRTAKWENCPQENAMEMAIHLSGYKMRSRSGTRIGGRMGRPGKSRPRKMNPPPHGLFPLGEAGGNRRSFQEASTHSPQVNMDGGVITIEVGKRRCPACGKETYYNKCSCGSHTEPVFECPKCHREITAEKCPSCGVAPACTQQVTLNVKNEYLAALDRLGIRNSSLALVKGVRGLISKERSLEVMEKGILRAQNDLYVFKDGTVRFDMIDLPLTHIRPDEVGVPVERLRELGYTKDTFGNNLERPDQVIELHAQDILISESCADYLVKIAKFMDDLLVKVYGMSPYYNIESKDGLPGHLVMGLAPHTSAGVLARVVGFSKANVGYAHPFFHAAKRRNCFHGDTEIEVYDGKTRAKKKIREFVLENFDVSQPGIDRLGTYYSDPQRQYYTRSVDTQGVLHMRKVTSVSIHRAPRELIQFTTTRGKKINVTPDHAMLVWDTSYLRKIRAMEMKPGDGVPVYEGGCVITDHIAEVAYATCLDERVYCLTVADDHTVLANDIFTGQCDGDEDCVMLLLDGLVNFSRTFLPDNRGGTMDAPLVLTTRIDPKEIDKESLNVDVCRSYPLELYTKALDYVHPKDIEALVDRVERRLGTPGQLEGFLYTHETSDISAGPFESMYTLIESMPEKLAAELELGRIIRAVDVDDIAERVLKTHFMPDLIGNLNSFSKQKFRCTKCNHSYRRMPLAGKCTRCGGNIIPTVHEGSVKKYLDMSRNLCKEYAISEYTRQRVEVLDMAIESTFGTPKVQQLGLADFM